MSANAKYWSDKDNPMIKSYVINLDRNPERFAHIDARFKELGLSYERIPAVDGKQIPRETFEAFAAARPMSGTGDSYSTGQRVWTPSSMGCFLSHFEAWRRISEGADEYGAIFEDDIHISDKIIPMLSDAAWIPAACEIIKLEPSYNRILTGGPVAKIAGRDIVRIKPSYRDHCWPVCCGGLIMKRETARKLIAAPVKDQMIVDVYLYAYKESPLASTLGTYQVSPAVCIQDKFLYEDQNKSTFKSNIEDVSEDRKAGISMARRLARKGEAFLRILQGHRKIGYLE